MASSKRVFRQHLLAELLPFLAAQGFEQWKPSTRDEVPVVYLRRARNGRRELVDIQFDKFGRLAFFVNLAAVTGETVETMFDGPLPADKITSGHLRDGCRIKGGLVSSKFKPSFLARLGGPEKSAENVAALFKNRFPEALNWFATGNTSKHILTYRL